MTYYTPGLGSCGVTNTDSEAIVALAEDMMTAAQVGGNPNDNPLCGKSITISWQGKTATAKIMDTCPGCADGGLDLTPTLFQEFAPLSVGRLTGMTWTFN
jgi:expansin (peptidoglycan-binding protein)